MTAKDYVAIAKAFAETKPYVLDSEEAYQWYTDTDAIADVFAADNSRFDHKRFLRACGREVK